MPITGLFEIHVTVGEEKIHDFRLYCEVNKYKTIYALQRGAAVPHQLMLSKWTNGTEEKAVNKAKEIEADLVKKGFRVLRTKVESMAHNDGVLEDSLEGKPGRYFEYHLAVPCDAGDYEQLIAVAAEVGAMVSYSFMKRPFTPLITIRYYGSRPEAETHKGKVVDHIKAGGFRTNDGIAQEYAVYDTDLTIDDGWLS